jgi:hypothetical protein
MPQIRRTQEDIDSDIKTQSKACSVCLQRKSFVEFYSYKNKSDGKSYRCKPCDDLARRKWAEDNPEKSKYSARNRIIKHRHGVDIPWYEQKLKSQGNTCAICGVDRNNCTYANEWSFAIDHCHKTGKLRGLLCNMCNRALGMFKDCPEVLRKAALYLEYYKDDTH